LLLFDKKAFAKSQNKTAAASEFAKALAAAFLPLER
jgi:hypothetical protein